MPPKKQSSKKRDLTHATQAGTSSSATQPPSITEIEGWDTKRLIEHLREHFRGKLVNSEKTLKILEDQEIDGETFLTLTQEELQGCGIVLGPAKAIIKYIDKLKGTPALQERVHSDALSSSSRLSKRKFVDIGWDPRKKALVALQNLPAPSEYAKQIGKRSCIRDEAPINHHRHPGRSDIPIQFYHEIFDTFLTRLEDGGMEEDDVRYQELSRQLVPRISELMESEADRRDVFLRFLRFLGLHMEPIVHGRMLSDGTLFTSGSRRFLLCNLEVKSDFPTGCCAYLQNVCYYARFVQGLSKENDDIAARTCFPAFLILLEGTYLSINGAVFADSICVDRLTAAIPLDRAAYDYTTLAYTARVLHALVTCIKDLDQHYTDIFESADISKAVSNGVFPRILDGVDLRYNRRIVDGKRLWLATMDDGDTERTVVVKFTERYATDVHHACAEKGIAPSLRFSLPLGYGWVMVVMDYLDGYGSLFDLTDEGLSEDVRASVHARLKILHDANFVHGDMRPPNILLGPDGDVQFIDFDWAGNIGDARYPASMNPNIDWHPDVGLGKPIKTSHDLYLVDAFFGDFHRPVSLPKRRRFCEWDSTYCG